MDIIFRIFGVLYVMLHFTNGLTITEKLEQLPQCSEFYANMQEGGIGTSTINAQVAVVAVRNNYYNYTSQTIAKGDIVNYILKSYDLTSGRAVTLTGGYALVSKANNVLYINGQAVLQEETVTGNKKIFIIDSWLPIGQPSTAISYLQTQKPMYSQFYDFLSASGFEIYNESWYKDVTYYIPTNDVFDKLGTDVKKTLNDKPQSEKLKIAKMHAVRGIHFESMLTQGEVLQSFDGPAEVYIDTNKAVSIENGYVTAQVVSEAYVQNAVVNSIDRILGFVYQTIYEMLQTVSNLNQYNQLIESISQVSTPGPLEVMQILKNEKTPKIKVTVLAPTNQAVTAAKEKQGNNLNVPDTFVKVFKDNTLVGMHDIKSIRAPNFSAKTISGKNATSRIDENNNVRLYVGSDEIEIAVPDMGATNGLVHQTSGFIGVKGTTLWDLMETNALVSSIFRDVAQKLGLTEMYFNKQTPLITAFIPSSAALTDIQNNERLKKILTDKDIMKQVFYRLIIPGKFIPLSTVAPTTYKTLSGETVTIQFSAPKTNGPSTWNIRMDDWIVSIDKFHKMEATNGNAYIVDGVILLNVAGVTGSSATLVIPYISLIFGALLTILLH